MYNPYAFTVDGFTEDYKAWSGWSGSSEFHDWRLGGRENGKLTVSFLQSKCVRAASPKAHDPP